VHRGDARVDSRKGLSIKDVQCGHFTDKEWGSSSDVDVRSFWCKKNSGFWIFWYVRTDKEEGLSQCGHFVQKGEESNFHDFVRTSFKDSPK